MTVARDGAVAPFDTTGENGGEIAHQLTIAEMPAHDHNMHPETVYHDLAEASADSGSQEQEYTKLNVGTRQTGSRGGDGTHNNLQPYLVIGARTIKYGVKY